MNLAELDGLAFAAQRGRIHEYPRDNPLPVTTLGQLLELIQYSEGGLLPPLHQAEWLTLGDLAAFEEAHRGSTRKWICPISRSVGFFRTTGGGQDDDADWVGFGLAAQKAAIMAGFHRTTAAQFVAALGELVSNICEHSGASASGIAAFRTGDECFEFAVADHGVGILESLRTCPEYTHLLDHGEALRLALKEGVSRFGPRAMRGYGFRPLFVGIANLSGYLRFRSGDHALVIDGQRIELMAAKTAQKVHMKGFLASVVCLHP